MKFKVPVIVVAALLIGAAAAYAHHSFAGTYIEGKLLRIEGDIVEFNIRNPHSYIVIEVTEKDGKKVKWGGEWVASRSCRRVASRASRSKSAIT